MPKKTMEEIKALVDQGEILAITMDTSVFDKFGCNLRYKGLTTVEQFKGKDISFVLSPVTIGEVRNHISAAIADAATKAAAGINQFFKASHSSLVVGDVTKDIGVDVDAFVIADEQIEIYLETVGATTITEQIDSAELVRRYFEVLPPFGKSSEKKAEFPDAIALLTLEKWAEANDTLVLAVCRDGDWEAFAADSDRLIHIDDLSAALGLFNDQDSVIAARIVNSIKTGDANSLESFIQTKLEYYIDGYDIDVEAASSLPYDYDIDSASISDWSYANKAAIVVVSSTEDEVVVSFDLKVEALIEASFHFSIRDSIDRDYVNLGGAGAEATAAFSVNAVATFSKSGDRDPDLIDLEINGRGVSVDFGSVEPDFR
ncbi:PIN domain-containing protein [Agrobacterium tumefaciens]|uniref:PIN domain-containing protein n=1 Tax=Agrobacterium tumefaciens TaxID=358 RepID=UPI00129AB60F|nr:PIN domain-containing protein [Agrobacterium tumefaciens]MRH98860.1 hypothetical protein [Agrobacterium tumefaciens]